MPSVLHRLFTFAKATSLRPLENFTTEALAAAIEKEPSPFLTVLHRVSPIPGDNPTRQKVKVATQVQVRGGVVDLQVVLDGGAVYWIEVKAHAGEHGYQLQNYKDAADRDHRRPKVVMLCKRALRPGIETIRWNDLRDEMVKSIEPRWRDLEQFLKEYAMADDFDKPITIDELASAKNTWALLAKTARIARELFEVEPIAKTVQFPESDATIATAIVQQFQRHGRFVLASRSYPTLLFGLLPKDGGDQLAIWVEFRPTDFDGRDAVFAVADKQGGLGETWTRRHEGWSRLLATKSIDGALRQDDAVAWLRARFAELEQSGVLRAAVGVASSSVVPPDPS